MSGFKPGMRVRVVNATDPDLNGITGTVARWDDRPSHVIVRVEVAGFMGEEAPFRTAELELLEAPAPELEPTEAIDPDVTTLRAAAAQARAEGQDADGPSRKAMFNFAAMLMNEADKVESGDRGTLPPVLASARVWLDEAGVSQ